MANISVLNMEGKEVGTLELNDAIFAVEVKEHLMHRAVVLQLANNRQGTQSAKTRAAVRGGGRKPWRQKGTGHARQGSIRSPQWKGGGVVFAPQPRDYSFKMNRKEKQAAICSALTTKLNENKLIVLDEFKLGEIKTKAAKKVLEDIKANKALIISFLSLTLLVSLSKQLLFFFCEISYHTSLLKAVIYPAAEQRKSSCLLEIIVKSLYIGYKPRFFFLLC